MDYASEHDEHAMTILGLSSKREVTRTSIRVRTAMAVQAREQGRYLGGRPPYGYRLADAGPGPDAPAVAARSAGVGETAGHLRVATCACRPAATAFSCGARAGRRP